jgi:hypothetical protein
VAAPPGALSQIAEIWTFTAVTPSTGASMSETLMVADPPAAGASPPPEQAASPRAAAAIAQRRAECIEPIFQRAP